MNDYEGYWRSSEMALFDELHIHVFPGRQICVQKNRNGYYSTYRVSIASRAKNKYQMSS